MKALSPENSTDDDQSGRNDEQSRPQLTCTRERRQGAVQDTPRVYSTRSGLSNVAPHFLSALTLVNNRQSKKRAGLWSNAHFYLLLLLTQTIFAPERFSVPSTVKPLLTFSPAFERDSDNFKDLVFAGASVNKMYSESRDHELFDPMVGKFYANFDNNEFFNSRLRWRGDAELASYAWSQYQDGNQINMLMTENRVNDYGHSSERTGCVGGSCSIQSGDPSLLDYDAIDVSWRQDIEREKNRLNEVNQPRDAFDAQYERDLQVLQEKGFMSTLTSEETNRYEELAKAHYADFYTSVAYPSGLKAASSSLTSSSHNRVSVSSSNGCSSSRAPEPKVFSSRNFESVAVPEPYQPTFPRGHYNNITDVYVSNDTSPVLGHYTTDGASSSNRMLSTVNIKEEEYSTYLANDQVALDISAAVEEQSREAFDNLLDKVISDHSNSDVEIELTPFDEIIPFFDDSLFESFATDASDVYTSTERRSTSPSSGFHSGSSRSPSPNENNDGNMQYRFYGKLAPKKKEHDQVKEENDCDEGYYDDVKGNAGRKSPRRRGRQSKDNELVSKYGLPASAEELAAMSHKTLQRVLKDAALNDVQRSLIKKIRRRGRNKEAARKCRERRVAKTASPGSGDYKYYP